MRDEGVAVGHGGLRRLFVGVHAAGEPDESVERDHRVAPTAGRDEAIHSLHQRRCGAPLVVELQGEFSGVEEEAGAGVRGRSLGERLADVGEQAHRGALLAGAEQCGDPLELQHRPEHQRQLLELHRGAAKNQRSLGAIRFAECLRQQVVAAQDEVVPLSSPCVVLQRLRERRGLERVVAAERGLNRLDAAVPEHVGVGLQCREGRAPLAVDHGGGLEPHAVCQRRTDVERVELGPLIIFRPRLCDGDRDDPEGVSVETERVEVCRVDLRQMGAKTGGEPLPCEGVACNENGLGEVAAAARCRGKQAWCHEVGQVGRLGGGQFKSTGQHADGGHLAVDGRFAHDEVGDRGAALRERPAEDDAKVAVGEFRLDETPRFALRGVHPFSERTDCQVGHPLLGGEAGELLHPAVHGGLGPLCAVGDVDGDELRCGALCARQHGEALGGCRALDDCSDCDIALDALHLGDGHHVIRDALGAALRV